jgi:hypothetical protein
MKTIEISDEAFNYLQVRAIPLQDTTVSVLDRLVEEHKSFGNQEIKSAVESNGARLDMSFGVANLPNVSFTTIDAATISGQSVKKCYWNDILADMILAAIKVGASKDKVKAILSAQIREGQHSDNGYRHVAGADFSFQGVDAERACKNIAALSKAFGIAVSIKLRWQSSPKAQFAGQVGHLVLP